MAGGYDDLKEGQTEKDRIRKSRIPLANFAVALRMGIAGKGSGQVLEDDEVECLLANQIYKVRTIFVLRSEYCLTIAGIDERLHFTRTCHGCTEQKGCFPRNRGMRA